MKDSVKFRKRNFKNCPRTVHVLSLKYAERGFFHDVVLWPFVNNVEEVNKEL